MMGFVISRKLWLPLVALTAATLAICELTLSGCGFGNDNVGAINDPGSAAPQSTPQIPESMKMGTASGETVGPPQGL